MASTKLQYTIPASICPATPIFPDETGVEPAQGPLEEHGGAGDVEHAWSDVLHLLQQGLPLQRAGGPRPQPDVSPLQPPLVREHAQVSGRETGYVTGEVTPDQRGHTSEQVSR